MTRGGDDHPYARVNPVSVKADQSEVEFVLEPAALTKGRVLDPDGKPLRGATIRVLRESVTPHTMMADDEGAFLLRLPPGEVIDLEFAGTAHKVTGVRTTQVTVPYVGRLERVKAGTRWLGSGRRCARSSASFVSTFRFSLATTSWTKAA